MRICFEATMAGTQVDFEGTPDELVITGVSNSQGEYVSFHRHVLPTQNEHHDVYCEYRDQQYAGTNCIQRCRVSPSSLHLLLLSPLSGLPETEEFDISLHLDTSSYQSLIAGLQHIFHGQESTLHINDD